ncbi:MAG: GNAT family N-acetyltransferase [Ktedonobacterales bacterium]
MNTPVASVHLRPITADNFQACLALEVDEAQRGLVAPNVKSLAEAYVNRNLTPLAIYDAATIGYEQPQLPMVGFMMYEVVAGVGFITRLMIDRGAQGKGYGRAAMIEVIRRLRMLPDVELIATSHRVENTAAAKLYRSLGFTDWPIGWAQENPDEVFLMLPDTHSATHPAEPAHKA